MISLFNIRKTMSWRPNKGVTSAKPERNKEGVGKEGQAITAGLILGLTSPSALLGIYMYMYVLPCRPAD